MRHGMIHLLRCPCGNELRLVPFVEESASPLLERPREGNNGNGSNGKVVKEGVLACSCGHLFPIMEYVPRLIDNAEEMYPEFFREHSSRIRETVALGRALKKDGEAESLKEFGRVQKSFSEEWAFFDYDTDKTWGWDQDQRRKVFLDDFGFEEKDVRGKLLLDAGCGNGALSATVSRLGLEVVGLDLSSSVEEAEKHKGRFAEERVGSVHYVQGNLFTPPLKKESFDLIYSSGVLHHTPNTRDTFLKVVPLLKRGGRMYIWVYSCRGLPVRLWAGHGRIVRDLVPMKWLFLYCRFLSPFYKLATGTLSALHLSEFRKRSTREITLDLFDAFSPPFNHAHREDEVMGWFRESGFTNIHVSGRQKHGFGVYGDMP